MTLQEAFAQQPTWVIWWLNWMAIGILALPLSLLIWKKARRTGAITLVAVVIAAVTIDLMYNSMGYVKLLGLPHIVLWTPLVIFIARQIRRDDMPVWPKRIMAVVLATFLISLAFDYVDLVRWLLGERTPTILPPEG